MLICSNKTKLLFTSQKYLKCYLCFLKGNGFTMCKSKISDYEFHHEYYMTDRYEHVLDEQKRKGRNRKMIYTT